MCLKKCTDVTVRFHTQHMKHRHRHRHKADGSVHTRALKRELAVVGKPGHHQTRPTHEIHLLAVAFYDVLGSQSVQSL